MEAWQKEMCWQWIMIVGDGNDKWDVVVGGASKDERGGDNENDNYNDDRRGW